MATKHPDISTEVIFNDHFNTLFDNSVRPVLLEVGSALEAEDNKYSSALETKKQTSDTVTDSQSEKKTTEITLSCSYCRVKFPNVEQQREHYTLDWHRYNLKQSLQSKQPVSEEYFNLKNEKDEVSSISGSDTEEEQDPLDALATAQGKIFLKNQTGQVFSLYKGVLLIDKKEDLSKVNFYERYKEHCQENKQWTVLMLGGGHFAGAVFNHLVPLVHKTFHCYTVRAGQGGSQSSRDGKSGGSHPKSAGASLRRYNEQALVDHVRSVLVNWSEEIKYSSLIFYRASSPYNRNVLFGGKDPLLDRNDPRLRTIPFSTGRATYAEVKRVHLELCSAHVYGSLEDVVSRLSKQKSPEKESKRAKARSSCINRAKSREVVERPLPGQNYSSENSDEITNNLSKLETRDHSSASSGSESPVLDSQQLEVSFEGLEEFGDSLSPEQRKRGHNRKKPRKSKNQKLREKEEARKRQLRDSITKGNPLTLDDLFQERLKTFSSDANISKTELAKDFFNEILDDKGNSFLHLAAMNEHEDLIKYLLNNEADPCLKNTNQQTPYSCTSSKLSRDALKKFAREHPDKYNYNRAQIPLNALTEEELAEKKRAQRKIKREKEKEKKKENHVKQKEMAEKDRFVNLSDREKRALAAERRILNVHGKVISRCFLCGLDMAGKVPFEYLENRFCSIDCLKSHRMKNTTNL